jgi:hypothetical protein
LKPDKPESAAPEFPAIALPDYEIIENKKYDSPIKSQVTMRALVSGKITEEGLKALLRKLYDSAMATRGFTYYEGPTNVFIYLYTSKENAEGGSTYIAMLSKTYGEKKPTVSIKAAQMAQLGKKPEVKFGLQESKRRTIYKEIGWAEDRAMKEAETQHGNLASNESKLVEKYRKQVAHKYGLTTEQLKEIDLEGFTKDWPSPMFTEAGQSKEEAPVIRPKETEQLPVTQGVPKGHTVVAAESKRSLTTISVVLKGEYSKDEIMELSRKLKRTYAPDRAVEIGFYESVEAVDENKPIGQYKGKGQEENLNWGGKQ